MSGRDASEFSEEGLAGWNGAGAALNRLDNDRRQFLGPRLDRREGLRVVEREDDRVRDSLLWNSRRVHGSDRGLDRAGSLLQVPDANEHRIVDAMITALELRDLLATRVCPGEAQGVKRRLRAGAAESRHLSPRDGLGDFPGELHLPFMRKGVYCAIAQRHLAQRAWSVQGYGPRKPARTPAYSPEIHSRRRPRACLPSPLSRRAGEDRRHASHW